MFDENAQLHTLEGVAAATIILLVIIYAIDATSMTPLTSSSSNVHVESELRALGQDILNTMDYAEPGYNSELKNFIVGWNGSQYIWNGSAYTSSNGCKLSSINSTIVKIFNQTLVRQGIAHNVELTFLNLNADNTTTPSTVKIIYNGDPSNNAVIVSRKIVFQDTNFNNNLTGKEEGEHKKEDTEECTNGNNGSINPIVDIDPSTNFYNIADIKLILWRM